MTVDFTSKTAEVARTHLTGTIWFAAALISVALPLTGLLANGWRPADLPGAAQGLWWFGAVVLVVGMLGLAYAGCPVLGIPLDREDRYKDLAIQGGVILFGVGGLMMLGAVLLAPA